VSEKTAWRALHAAWKERMAWSCPAFLSQSLVFSMEMLFWPCNPLRERYNSWEPALKREIPAKKWRGKCVRYGENETSARDGEVARG
jgi:hypothetical protein